LYCVEDESANILRNLDEHFNDNIVYLLQILRNQNTEEKKIKKYQPAKTSNMDQLYLSNEE